MSSYPKDWWLYCTEHDDWDTNGDGMCRRYGTAHPASRRDGMTFCNLLGHGQGRRPEPSPS